MIRKGQSGSRRPALQGQGRRKRGSVISGVLRVIGVLAMVALIGLGVLAAALVETQPRVVSERPADGAAAGRALDVYRSARAALLDADADAGAWRVTEEEINDVFAAAARMREGLAGRAHVDASGVIVEASLPLHGTRLWLNGQGGLYPSDQGLALTEVQIGRVSLPPWLAEPAARVVLDIVLGSGAGRAVFRTVEAVKVDPPAVEVSLASLESDRQAFGAQVRQALRDRAGAEDEDRVLAYLHALQRARREGALPEKGSLVHHLQFVLTHAAGRAEAEGGEAAKAELRAGLFALALACGHRRFGMVIGIDAPRSNESCTGIRLADRSDLRRHFAVSAGLAAATSLGEAHGIGELKELYDSDGGSGFSFDDMAANLAGTRFAQEALALGPGGWTDLALAIVDEDAVMPPIADLPSQLREDEFRRRYGDVDSPEYQAMLREIERRIARLPLYLAGSG